MCHGSERMIRKKLELTLTCELCLRAAKVLAVREGCKSVDSIHVFAAGVQSRDDEVPHAIKSAGFLYPRARNLAARHWKLPDEIPDCGPMTVAPELGEALYGNASGASRVRGKLGTGALLKRLLERPSYRLRVLLEQLVPGQETSSLRPTGRVQPYKSFLDYLRDRGRLFDLCFRAAASATQTWHLEGGDSLGGTTYGTLGILGALARLEQRVRCRVKATPTQIMATRVLAEGRGLPEIEIEILEAFFVHEVYGSLSETRDCGLSVRDLARMLGPLTFPRNCALVLASCQELARRGILAELGDQGGGLMRLASRVCLAVPIQKRLVDSLDLSEDRAGDADIEALELHLASSPRPPDDEPANRDGTAT